MKQWCKKHSICLSLLLVLAVMGMIFSFSAQTGENSGALSGKITAWVVKLFVPEFNTFPDYEQEALLNTVGFFVRKAAHFSEFALLGFSLMLHIQQLQKRLSICAPWLWAWAVGTGYAVTDELHQHFVGGRYPAVTDVLIDSSGVFAGLALFSGILWWIRRRKCKSCGKTGE